MTRAEMDIQLLQRICNGDAEAMDFLARHWAPYVHGIDDIIDGDANGPEEILKVFAAAAMLYSHPFYLRNLNALRAVVLMVTNMYADSVKWEKSLLPWRREWADHARHVGMEMVIAVAQIAGGYEHGRRISEEQRAICYVEHHTREGKAI